MSIAWLTASELRIGLGCMRLPTDDGALATIAAAAESGITLYDTARAYGGNEAAARSGSTRLRRGGGVPGS